MQITLTYSDLLAVMERSLSIIAKRSTDDQGNRLFDNITLGSREKQIASDFFTTAFIELSAELSDYITTEIQNASGFVSVAYISWWTDQNPASFVNLVTANGQYLYKHDTHKLYQASLSFPTQTATIATGTLFVYNNGYYRFTQGTGLTQLTDAQVAQLTE